ncbi:hypothetical protein FRC08_003320 [Ceratobasidium sp. 394]|nr:hypothetical protein FRC08_003320 [Ceratobasidium sp. 394]
MTQSLARTLVTGLTALTLLFFALDSSSVSLPTSTLSAPHNLTDLGDILAESNYSPSPTHFFDLPLYHEPALSVLFGPLFDPPQPPSRGIGLDDIHAVIHGIRGSMQVVAQVLPSVGLSATKCGDAALNLLSMFYSLLRGGDWCAVAIALAMLVDLSLLLVRSIRPARTHVNVAPPAPISALGIGQRKQVLELVLRGSRVSRTEVDPAIAARRLHYLSRRSLYLSSYPTLRVGVALTALMVSLPFDLPTLPGLRTTLSQANPTACQPHGKSSALESGRIALVARRLSRSLVLTAGQRKEVMSLVLARSLARDARPAHALTKMGLDYLFRRSIYPTTYPTITARVRVSLSVADLLACFAIRPLAIRPSGYTHAPAKAPLLIEYRQENESPVVSDDKPEVKVGAELREHIVRKAVAPIWTLSIGRREEVLELVLRSSRAPRAEVAHLAINARWLHNFLFRSPYPSSYSTLRAGVAPPTLVVSLPFDLPTLLGVRTPAPVSTLSIGQRKEVLELALSSSRVPRAEVVRAAVDVRRLHAFFRQSLYPSPYPTLLIGVVRPTLMFSLPLRLPILLGIHTTLPQANPAACRPHGKPSVLEESGRVALVAPRRSLALMLTAGQRKEAMSLVLAHSQVRDPRPMHALVNMGLAYLLRRSMYPIFSTTTARMRISLLVANLPACSAIRLLVIRPSGYPHAPAKAPLLIEYHQEEESPVVADEKPEVEVEVEAEQRAPAVRKALREPKFALYVPRALRNAAANSHPSTQGAASSSLLAKDRHTQEEQDARRGNPETRLGSFDPDTVDAALERPETTLDAGVEGTPKLKRTRRGKRGGQGRANRLPPPGL